VRVVTFKIEEDLLEQLDYYAINHHLNRSEAIRMMIATVVKQEREKEPPIPNAKIEKLKL